MDAISVGLLLAAAVCHAGWNLQLKCCADKNLVAWWALVVTAPLALPFLWRGGVPLSLWPFLAASAACEAGYYYALTWAYRDGDFSLVYPIARGTAPVWVLIWATIFLHERPQPLGLLGIFLIVLGVAVTGGLWQWLRDVAQRGVGKIGGLRAAFLVALFISGYTTFDGAAVKHCEPLAYTAIMFALTALVVTPLFARRPLAELRAGFGANRNAILLIAPLSLLSYGLVLLVYSRGSLSYAAAGREVSIVFGALAGWRFLNESLGAIRVLGALLIFSGIATIAIWG